MNKLLCLILTLAPAAFAGDWFAIGARVGVPFTDAFESVKSGDYNLESATKRFTIGPSAELLLPFGLGVEADILYKKTDVTITELAPNGTDSGTPATTMDSVGVWEIPLLAKFRLPGAGLRPFVAAGGSYRSFGDFPSISTNLNDSGWGFVMGGGLEIKVSRVRISPELRYTRWGSGERSEGDNILKFARNQAEFLIGITF